MRTLQSLAGARPLRTVLSTSILGLLASGLTMGQLNAANKTWDGGGGDNNWQTGGNWDLDVAPVPTDALFFDGSLRLTPNNDFAAGTQFNGLTFNSGAGAFTLGGNSVALGGNITDASTNAQIITNALTLGGSRTVAVLAGGPAGSGGALTISGVISDGGSSSGLTLVNISLNRLQTGPGGVLSTGALTLTGANTYTGPTVVQTGTLALDFSAIGAPASNIVSPSSALTLGSTGLPTAVPGVGILSMVGSTAANAQTFNGTTIGVGANQISVPNGTLALGGITRLTGGLVIFSPPGTFTPPGIGAITTTTPLPATGILGAWATVGTATAPTDWATLKPTANPDGSRDIEAYTGYVAVSGAATVTNPSTPAGSNIKWTNIANGAGIGAAATTTELNSIVFSDNFALTVTLNNGTLRLGAQGGIFRSSTAGNVNTVIATGTITAGGGPNTAGEIVLMVNQTGDNNSNNLQINAAIADNGGSAFPVTVTKAGRGSLAINGANTYTGGTYINEGRVQLSSATGFGSAGSNVYVEPGGHLFFNNVAANYNYFIAGLGSTETSGRYGAIRINNNNISGTVTLTGDARISSTNANSQLSALITGSFNLELGVEAANSGTLSLVNTGNNWSGNTSILRGVVKLGNSNVIPNGSSAGNLTLDSSGTNITVTTATLDLNGKDETINGLFAAGTPTSDFIQNNLAATIGTLRVGDNDTSSIFGGVIRDNSGVGGTVALAKIGNGTLTLSGANTFTAASSVDAGILLVNGSITAALTVASGATLGGTGNISPGGVTLASAANLAPGNNAVGTLSLLNGGSLNLSAAAGGTGYLKFELGTPAASDKVLLTGSSTLNIGANGLDLDDFAFTDVGGFGIGTYTLFDCQLLILGTLGPNVTGTVLGFDATLMLADGGRDLVLNVVPEPGVGATLLGGLGVLLGWRYRHRRR